MKTVYNHVSHPIWDKEWDEDTKFITLAKQVAKNQMNANRVPSLEEGELALRRYLALPWYSFIRKYKIKKILRKENYALNSGNLHLK